MRRTAQLLIAALTLGLASTAMAQGDRILIDYVDTSKYLKSMEIRYYLDILNRDNRVIPEQDKDKLQFFVNDEPIPGEMIKGLELSTFEEVGEPVAVGVLFTKYGGFVPKSEGEPSLFGYSQRGIVEFLKELKRNTDRCGIWLYDETDNDQIQPFTGNTDGCARVVDDLAPIRFEPSEDDEVQAPSFYRYLDGVVRKMAELDDLPRRRILIVVSDGVGEYNARQKKQIDRKLSAIIETALEKNIKIYGFGAFLQEDQFLTSLSRLSERTYGVYQRIEEPELLEGAIRDLAPQLKKQYVADITLDYPGMPHEDRVKLRVDAETPNAETISAVYPKSVQFAELPTRWWFYVKWSLIILGSLIGVILFFWIIAKIIRAIRNREPREREVVYEGGGYDGPDHGKLRVRSGPLAGEVLPLIGEITTIGSLDGNDIVLPDEGVSKRHAGIKIEDMRYELADFGSTNGTWVNGRKINKQFLRDGDEIRIGNSEMVFTLK